MLSKEIYDSLHSIIEGFWAGKDISALAFSIKKYLVIRIPYMLQASCIEKGG